MTQTLGFTYSVNLVLIIDATGSMAPIIERVKTSAPSFHDDLQKSFDVLGKSLDALRVRVIAFRDYYADSAEDSLIASDFFDLPAERNDFEAFLRGITATGRGDEPKTGLEALAEAIRSPWVKGRAKDRQIIVLWTDASAHPLEKNRNHKPPGYPDAMPADLDELTDSWDGQESPMNQVTKRLLLFSPDVFPWTDIANNWEQVLLYASAEGEGLGDKDYRSIFDAIAQSI